MELVRDDQMKVLHVVRQYSPAIGGLENFVKSLAKEQSENGVYVEVITLNKVFHTNEVLKDREVIEGVPVTRIPYLGSYKYPVALKVKNMIAGFDIIHIHGVDFFVDFISMISFFKKRKIILSTHGGFFHTKYASKLKEIYFNTITRFVIKRIDLVIACSVNDYELFNKIVDSSKLVLIENGVDLKKFNECSNSTPNKSFVFIGRFSDNKRLDLLIRLFDGLVKIDDSYELKIIGKDWDGNKNKLKELIGGFKLSENVSILTGLSDKEIKKHLVNSSFIISASDYEGFGLTVIEGMSAGLLPVLSYIPSFNRIVSELDCGSQFEFTKVSPKVFDAEILSQLKDYSSKRDSVIKSSKNYSWDYVSQKFLGYYEKVLNKDLKVIQGIKVLDLDAKSTMAYIENRLETESAIKIAFANAHMVNVSNRNSKLKNALRNFIVLNDGVGLSIASKLKYGEAFKENMNGTDFVPIFLESSTIEYNIYLLGATEDSVSSCFKKWSNLYPQHNFVGYRNGYFTDSDQPEIISEVRKLGTDVIIVAMGNPHQELWLNDHLEASGAKIGIGVGALFDFTSGKVKRAPKLIRKVKCEWLFRLAQEPKRLFSRYFFGNAIFLKNSMLDKDKY